MPQISDTALKLGELGIKAYIKGNWSDAISHFTNGLKLIKEDIEPKASYYRNRAAAYLKLHDYDNVIKDCNSALKICCNTALYHRCQALEALEKFKEAYRDAEIMHSSDPNNEVIKSVKERLYEIVEGRRDPNLSATISQLLDLVSNVSKDNETRETAMNKLYTFACDEAGAEEIFQKEGVSKIAQLVKIEKNEEVICSAIRIVGKLCKNSIGRTETVKNYVGLSWCLDMMNNASTEIVNASQSCLQIILNAYCGINDERRPKPDMSLCLKFEREIYTILSCLLNSVTSRTTTALAKNVMIEFITRNMQYVALKWAEQLVNFGGLKKLMEVATQLEERESLNITSSTQTVISMALAKIYKNISCNDDKGTFTNTIYEFIQDKLLKSDTESKVHGIVAIITLIFGPFKVADEIIFKQGMIERIFAMAKTNDVLQQKVVCECVLLCLQNYKKTNDFILKAADTLNDLHYFDDNVNDSIKFRAFIGLIMMSKFGIINYSLEKSKIDDWGLRCTQFLINGDEDLRKWAIKGLSYVSLYTNTKKSLFKDENLVGRVVKVMSELAKTDEHSTLCSIIITLINLCNVYEEGKDPIREIKFKKFISFYFHEDDLVKDDDLVEERRRVLAHKGVIGVLKILANTDNEEVKELTAAVFVALCGQEQSGEMVVLQGRKALLLLAMDGTDKGKKNAVQVLLRLARLNFESVSKVAQLKAVQLFINVLDCSVDSSANLEYISALCNLARVNDNLRKHIVNTAGFEKIELYMHDDMVKQKTAELINNLVLCHEVAVQYGQQNLTLIYDAMFEEDEHTIKALAGTVVMMTAVSKEACEEIFSSDPSLKFLYNLLTNPDDDLQRKGTEIVLNMMKSTKDVAVKLMEMNTIMKQVTALSKNDTIHKEINKLASLVLEAAAKCKNVEGNGEGNESSD